MITPVDDRLREEADRYRLRFGCEHCFAWNDETGRCSHEFPNDEHVGVEALRSDRVVFCKEFELR